MAFDDVLDARKTTLRLDGGYVRAVVDQPADETRGNVGWVDTRAEPPQIHRKQYDGEVGRVAHSLGVVVDLLFGLRIEVGGIGEQHEFSTRGFRALYGFDVLRERAPARMVRNDEAAMGFINHDMQEVEIFGKRDRNLGDAERPDETMLDRQAHVVTDRSLIDARQVAAEGWDDAVHRADELFSCPITGFRALVCCHDRLRCAATTFNACCRTRSAIARPGPARDSSRTRARRRRDPASPLRRT